MDPVTLALVGGAVAPAVTFLMDRANRVLDERAARRRQAPDSGSLQQTPEVVNAPGVLQGELAPLAADPEIVEARQAELAAVVGQLSPYTRDPQLIDDQDQELLTLAGRLREILEEVYGQRITFVGEDREATGSSVRIRQVADVHEGDMTGVGKIHRDYSKNVDVDQRVGRTVEGSRVVGVDEIG